MSPFPALTALRNGLEREAGHHCYYSRVSPVQVLAAAAGWTVETTRYNELPGVPAGWLRSG